MPNFFFWNTAGKPVEKLISAAAESHDVDLFLLAECSIDTRVLIRSLNSRGSGYRRLRSSLCRRITILTRYSSDYIRPFDEGERYSISRVKMPAREEILLVSAHLPSKLEFSDASQAQECARLARLIIAAEESVGHQRTLFMGDINVNPFEAGVVGAGALHAVMTKNTAARNSRTIQGEDYRFFYNPMWSHFGDGRSDAPPGTYYYEKAEHVMYFWNIFDQVLLRPALAGSFRHEDLAVLTHIGSESLLSPNGRPNKEVSDHLPLLLRLNF
jgi:hypothetical protein